MRLKSLINLRMQASNAWRSRIPDAQALRQYDPLAQGRSQGFRQGKIENKTQNALLILTSSPL